MFVVAVVRLQETDEIVEVELSLSVPPVAVGARPPAPVSFLRLYDTSYGLPLLSQTQAAALTTAVEDALRAALAADAAALGCGDGPAVWWDAALVQRTVQRCPRPPSAAAGVSTAVVSSWAVATQSRGDERRAAATAGRLWRDHVLPSERFRGYGTATLSALLRGEETVEGAAAAAAEYRASARHAQEGLLLLRRSPPQPPQPLCPWLAPVPPEPAPAAAAYFNDVLMRVRLGDSSVPAAAELSALVRASEVARAAWAVLGGPAAAAELAVVWYTLRRLAVVAAANWAQALLVAGAGVSRAEAGRLARTCERAAALAAELLRSHPTDATRTEAVAETAWCYGMLGKLWIRAGRLYTAAGEPRSEQRRCQQHLRDCLRRWGRRRARLGEAVTANVEHLIVLLAEPQWLSLRDGIESSL